MQPEEEEEEEEETGRHDGTLGIFHKIKDLYILNSFGSFFF